MKIGLFTDGYFPLINGVSTSVAELKQSLQDRGHEVYVIAPNFPQHQDKEKNIFRLKSFRLYKNPELRLSYMFPDRVFQQVLKVDFDVLHGFSGGAIPSLGLALAKFKRKPYVFTYNTRLNQYTHYVLGGKLIRPKAVEKVVELYCNVCDYVIAPVQFVRDELIEFGVKKPITVIPNGVDTNLFKPGKSEFLKDKYNLKKNDKIILYTGRVAKEKSIDFLLKTFARVLKKNKNIYFVIVGDGPAKGNIEELANKLKISKNVIFTGFIPHDQLSEVYQSADLFVFGSTTETQGLVVLEAMSCGLPTLVAKDLVLGEFIKPEIDGFIVDKDQQLFSEKILQILSSRSLQDKISKAARQKAESFSLQKIAEKFENLYKELS